MLNLFLTLPKSRRLSRSSSGDRSYSCSSSSGQGGPFPFPLCRRSLLRRKQQGRQPPFQFIPLRLQPRARGHGPGRRTRLAALQRGPPAVPFPLGLLLAAQRALDRPPAQGPFEVRVHGPDWRDPRRRSSRRGGRDRRRGGGEEQKSRRSGRRGGRCGRGGGGGVWRRPAGRGSQGGGGNEGDSDSTAAEQQRFLLARGGNADAFRVFQAGRRGEDRGAELLRAEDEREREKELFLSSRFFSFSFSFFRGNKFFVLLLPLRVND